MNYLRVTQVLDDGRIIAVTRDNKRLCLSPNDSQLRKARFTERFIYRRALPASFSLIAKRAAARRAFPHSCPVLQQNQKPGISTWRTTRHSITFDKVKLAGVDTVTLKDVNGKITAEIE